MGKLNLLVNSDCAGVPSHCRQGQSDTASSFAMYFIVQLHWDLISAAQLKYYH